MECLLAYLRCDADAIKTMLKDPLVVPTIMKIRRRGKGILHLSSQYGKVEIVKLLLADGRFDPNQKDDSNDSTPLMYACMSGKNEIVKLLLKDPRVDINITDSYSHSCLFHCCLFGKHELVEAILLDENFNKKDYNTIYISYREACSRNNIKIIKLMLVLIDNCDFETVSESIYVKDDTRNVLDTFKNSQEYIDMKLKYCREYQAGRIFYNIVMLNDNYLKVHD